MLSFENLNVEWARALRAHALNPLDGERGPYRAISDRSLNLLDVLWKAKPALPDLGALIADGKDVRFWGDPHFDHANIIKLAGRVEFSDVAEMNRVLWDNVGAAAEEADLVVCLGDFALREPLAVHRRLVAAHGEKHLTLVGNHDAKGAKAAQWATSGALASLAFSLPTDMLRGWAKADHHDLAGAVDWDELPSRVNFGCSHWPVPPARLPGAGWVNLHGHIHNRPAGRLRVNCSVEAIGYAPKTLRQLVTPELFSDLALRQRGLDALPKEAATSAPDAM